MLESDKVCQPKVVSLWYTTGQAARFTAVENIKHRNHTERAAAR